MKNILIGMLAGVLLLGGLLQLGQNLEAQQARLQLNASGLVGNLRVHATCDTGNGVMIYIVEPPYGGASAAVSAVPNGCSKKP